MSRGGTEGPDENNSASGDDIDRANVLAQMFTDASVAVAMLRCKPEQVVGADGEYPTPDCVDCGEPIIAARLQMGKVRCIDCQTRLEFLRRLH